MFKYFVLSAACIFAVSTSLHAAVISGADQITFSGATGVTSIVTGSYAQVVDDILDTPGAGGNTNGLSIETFPLKITYNFDVAYDLNTFFLMGEFGSNNIGSVTNFDVTFWSGLDGGGPQVGAVFSDSQTAPTSLQSFDISSGGYDGVRSFTFTPTNARDKSHPQYVAGRVEFSEIQFEGSAAAVPLPASIWFFSASLISFIGVRSFKSK